MPAPKLATRLPFVSNFSTVGSCDIVFVARSRQLLLPHRSATQIDFPSLSRSMALVDPQVRPAGSLKYPLIVLYGFGASLVGCAAVCADIRPPDVASAAAAATARTMVFRRDDITVPPLHI